jgi:hypothetical protein
MANPARFAGPGFAPAVSAGEVVSSGLVGRGGALQLIDEFLARAVKDGGALLLPGAPGISVKRHSATKAPPGPRLPVSLPSAIGVEFESGVSTNTSMRFGRKARARPLHTRNTIQINRSRRRVRPDR